MDFRRTSLAELSDQVQSRSLSAREIVGHAIERIEALEPRLNVWAALDLETPARRLKDGARDPQPQPSQEFGN